MLVISVRSPSTASLTFTGKKPYCRSGIQCYQCEEEKNTAECNVRYADKCLAQCEAKGPTES